MKNIITLLAMFGILFINAQNPTVQIETMRVNRSASLALTTSWQTLDFNGTSAFNENTFGIDPVSGNKMVYWDATNKLFKVINNYDRLLNIQIFPESTSTGLGITTVPTKVQYRIVVPNGVSPGVDLVVPYLDSTNPGYGDLDFVHLLSGVRHPTVNLNVKASPTVRANGFYVQFRLSNSMVLGGCNISYCSINIQSVK